MSGPHDNGPDTRVTYESFKNSRDSLGINVETITWTVNWVYWQTNNWRHYCDSQLKDYCDLKPHPVPCLNLITPGQKVIVRKLNCSPILFPTNFKLILNLRSWILPFRYPWSISTSSSISCIPSFSISFTI